MMDSLSGITAFIHVAETRSFTEAGRLLEISSSAVGKNVGQHSQSLKSALQRLGNRRFTETETEHHRQTEHTDGGAQPQR